MKEVVASFTPTAQQMERIVLDQKPYESIAYRTDRSLAVDNFINFDFFNHLQDLKSELGRRLEVLEGGCGQGIALRQLKKGGRISRESDYEYPGLGQDIRTTGVTLSKRHIEAAKKVAEEVRIDEMIVSPLETYDFDRQYDFIYDFCGAAMHFPEDVIPVYGKILMPNRLAFIRLMTGAMPSQLPKKLFDENGFEILKQNGNKFATMDFLLKKV